MRYTIKEWIDPKTGLGAYSQRYARLGDAGQAMCDVRILYLREQPPTMWRDPYAKKMSWEYDDDCKDLYEIRFKANNLQQRPMGYFGPKPGEFTIVVWVTHKGKQYDPSNFAKIAKARWDDVCSGVANIKTVEIDEA